MKVDTSFPLPSVINLCNSLINVFPDSVTEIEDSAFWGCNNLTPGLLLYANGTKCYGWIGEKNCDNIKIPDSVVVIRKFAFEGCTSLAKAPQLPATSLTEYCYAYMFYGCEQLTVAPILAAHTLVEGCYWRMFANCSQLINITMLANDISPAYCLDRWVSGVSETGLFTKSVLMTSLVNGESGIPNGWTVDNWGN